MLWNVTTIYEFIQKIYITITKKTLSHKELIRLVFYIFPFNLQLTITIWKIVALVVCKMSLY